MKITLTASEALAKAKADHYLTASERDDDYRLDRWLAEQDGEGSPCPSCNGTMDGALDKNGRCDACGWTRD